MMKLRRKSKRQNKTTAILVARWCPRNPVQLVNMTPISLWFVGDISFDGVYKLVNRPSMWARLVISWFVNPSN